MGGNQKEKWWHSWFSQSDVKCWFSQWFSALLLLGKGGPTGDLPNPKFGFNEQAFQSAFLVSEDVFLFLFADQGHVI